VSQATRFFLFSRFVGHKLSYFLLSTSSPLHYAPSLLNAELTNTGLRRS
jgi:hypothetical protein